MIKTQQRELEHCMVCFSNKRNTLSKPCDHISVCDECSVNFQICLICDDPVRAYVDINKCLVCNERQASVLTRPCGHMLVCDVCSMLLEKCVDCGVECEAAVSYMICCGGSVAQGGFQRDPWNSKELKKLQNELIQIKEQVC